MNLIGRRIRQPSERYFEQYPQSTACDLLQLGMTTRLAINACGCWGTNDPLFVEIPEIIQEVLEEQ